MAYSNTDKLVTVGNYVIPLKYIAAESYDVLYSTSDLDSYRDANGVLHRNPLAHKVGKVEFNTPRLLTNTELQDLLTNIRNNYKGGAGDISKTATVKFWNPEYDNYITQDMYVPDINFEIFGIFDGVVKFNAVRIAFIAY